MDILLFWMWNYLKKYDWKGLIKSFIWAGLLALMIRSFIFEPYKVISGSMKPTLLVEDYIFLTKYNYGFSRYSFLFGLPIMDGRILFTPPKRGDIIVFKLPNDTSKNYIKRLVGLPGDEIQMKEGVLHINGYAVKKIKKGIYNEVDEEGKEWISDLYEETLPNGVSYTTMYNSKVKDHDFQDNTPLYKVPEKMYFFMGDNRNNSIDSRYLDKVGFIPEENLLGRAKFLAMTDDFSLVNFFTKLEHGRAFDAFHYEN